MEKNQNSLLVKVAHSPDPDDAFMFYAMAKERLDTGKYSFRSHYDYRHSAHQHADHEAQAAGSCAHRN